MSATIVMGSINTVPVTNHKVAKRRHSMSNYNFYTKMPLLRPEDCATTLYPRCETCSKHPALARQTKCFFCLDMKLNPDRCQSINETGIHVGFQCGMAKMRGQSHCRAHLRGGGIHRSIDVASEEIDDSSSDENEWYEKDSFIASEDEEEEVVVVKERRKRPLPEDELATEDECAPKRPYAKLSQQQLVGMLHQVTAELMLRTNTTTPPPRKPATSPPAIAPPILIPSRTLKKNYYVESNTGQGKSVALAIADALWANANMYVVVQKRVTSFYKRSITERVRKYGKAWVAALDADVQSLESLHHHAAFEQETLSPRLVCVAAHVFRVKIVLMTERDAEMTSREVGPSNAVCTIHLMCTNDRHVEAAFPLQTYNRSLLRKMGIFHSFDDRSFYATVVKYESDSTSAHRFQFRLEDEGKTWWLTEYEIQSALHNLPDYVCDFLNN